jgi:hypothetical protein
VEVTAQRTLDQRHTIMSNWGKAIRNNY